MDEDDFVLPDRLFATDRYPPDGRINSYSKPEYLLDIVEALEGTPEFDIIKNSSLGSLFELPVRRCSLSGKLIHNFLCRSLHISREHEIWFVFGGKPFRFSLREFALVTGLPCGPFPDAAAIRKSQTPDPFGKPYWNKLMGNKTVVTIQDIVKWLKQDKRMPKKMPGWKKVRLALIVIVEGILIVNSQPVRASMEVVEMVKNLDTFFAYPWGRESFALTLRMIKVGSRVGTVEELVDKLLQSHTATHGFTLSIQLFILQSIPLLQLYLPDMADDQNFMDRSIVQLTKLKTYHNANIFAAEHHSALEVIPILQPDHALDDTETSWPQEVEDPSVDHLLRMIKDGYNFTKDVWHGGHDALPLMTPSAPALKLLTSKLRGSSLNRVDVVRKSQACPKIDSKDKGKYAVEANVDLDDQSQSVSRIDVNDILMQVDKKNIAHLAEVEKIMLRWKDDVMREVLNLLGNHGLSIPSGLFGSDLPGCSKFVPQDITNVNATCSMPGKEIPKGNLSPMEGYGNLASILNSLNSSSFFTSTENNDGLVSKGTPVLDNHVLASKGTPTVDNNNRVGRVDGQHDQAGKDGLADQVENDGQAVTGEDNVHSAHVDRKGNDGQVFEREDVDPNVTHVEDFEGLVGEYNNDNAEVDGQETKESDGENDGNESDDEDEDENEADGQKHDTDGQDSKESRGQEYKADGQDTKESDGQGKKHSGGDVRDFEESYAGDGEDDDESDDEDEYDEGSNVDGQKERQNRTDGDEEDHSGDQVEGKGQKQIKVSVKDSDASHGQHDNPIDVQEESSGSEKEDDESKEEINGEDTPDNSEEDQTGGSSSDEEMGYQSDRQIEQLDVNNTVVNLGYEVGNTSQGTKVRGKKRQNSDVDSVGLSDVEPRAKRNRIPPKRYQYSSSKKKSKVVPDDIYSPLGVVHYSLKKKFLSKISAYKKKEYFIDGHPVKKTFFTDLHTPKKWVDTIHMEVLLSLVWRKLGDSFLHGRIAVLDTWFTNTLSTEYLRFNKNPRSFSWSSMVKNYVQGNVPTRSTKMAWFSDVDTIYAPMNWGKRHWVTLVIQLRESKILILDPYINATAERKMNTFMHPISALLPLMIKDLAKNDVSSANSPAFFTFERVVDIYQNIRSGDCGPVAVKFIELHAQGLDLDSLTDPIVDQLRMKFAVDAYEEFVESLRD